MICPGAEATMSTSPQAALRNVVKYQPGRLEFIGQMSPAQRDALQKRVDSEADRKATDGIYQKSHIREVPDWVPESIKPRVELWFQRRWPAEVWQGVQGRQYHYVAWIFYALVIAFCMSSPYWRRRRGEADEKQKQGSPGR